MKKQSMLVVLMGLMLLCVSMISADGLIRLPESPEVTRSQVESPQGQTGFMGVSATVEWGRTKVGAVSRFGVIKVTAKQAIKRCQVRVNDADPETVKTGKIGKGKTRNMRFSYTLKDGGNAVIRCWRKSNNAVSKAIYTDLFMRENTPDLLAIQQSGTDCNTPHGTNSQRCGFVLSSEILTTDEMKQSACANTYGAAQVDVARNPLRNGIIIDQPTGFATINRYPLPAGRGYSGPQEVGLSDFLIHTSEGKVYSGLDITGYYGQIQSVTVTCNYPQYQWAGKGVIVTNQQAPMGHVFNSDCPIKIMPGVVYAYEQNTTYFDQNLSLIGVEYKGESDVFLPEYYNLDVELIEYDAWEGGYYDDWSSGSDPVGSRLQVTIKLTQAGRDAGYTSVPEASLHIHMQDTLAGCGYAAIVSSIGVPQ